MIAMARDSSSNEFEGKVLQCADYTWKLGRRLGTGTCSVVVEAVGTFTSNNRQRKPRDVKAAVKIFKQGPQFEAAGANEMEILEYLSRQRDPDYKCYVGEFAEAS